MKDDQKKTEIEIIKVDRTDKEVDNTAFYIKVAMELEDDFGNKAEGLFKKQLIDITDLERKVKEGKEAEALLIEIEKLKQ